jgi:hypothetical protein
MPVQCLDMAATAMLGFEPVDGYPRTSGGNLSYLPRSVDHAPSDLRGNVAPNDFGLAPK